MENLIPLTKNGKGQYKCLDTEKLEYRNIGADEIHLIQKYLDNSGILLKDNGSKVIRPLRAVNAVKKLKVLMGYDMEKDMFVIADLSGDKPVKKTITGDRVKQYLKHNLVVNIEVTAEGVISTVSDLSEDLILEIPEDEVINKTVDNGWIDYVIGDTTIKVSSSELDRFYNSSGVLVDPMGFAEWLEVKQQEYENSLGVHSEEVVSTSETITNNRLSSSTGLYDEVITTKAEIYKNFLISAQHHESIRLPYKIFTEFQPKWVKTIDSIALDVENEIKAVNKNIGCVFSSDANNYDFNISYIAAIYHKDYIRYCVVNRYTLNDNSMIQVQLLTDWEPKGKNINTDKLYRDYKEWRRRYFTNIIV